MAGAGYKLFNTGDVLTAAQVNTYLMEQTVMVFADAAARTTALSGVVSEGMISYLKDTNAVEVYDGSNWVSSDDPNAIQNTIVDAKGDLISASAADTPARLAVGNNGENLVADNSASTGLRWQGNFSAGKNKIINGDFAINQRNFTSSTTTDANNFDRWVQQISGGTVTVTPQTFTLGAAPVAGYEGTNFLRQVVSGQSASGDYASVAQKIEDVRTFANQTVVASFWAKASSGTPSISVELSQNFSGGSATVNTYLGKVTLSTSWTRYSVSVLVPSISGKTIGSGTGILTLRLYTSAGSSLDARTGTLGIQNNTFDFWGVQLEAGNVATAFQTATGTLAGELAACQRYYVRSTATAAYGTVCGTGAGGGSTTAQVVYRQPVTMRTSPSSVEYANIATNDGSNATAITNVAITRANPDLTELTITVASGLTQYRPYFVVGNNNAAGYIGLNAEL